MYTGQPTASLDRLNITASALVMNVTSIQKVSRCVIPLNTYQV